MQYGWHVCMHTPFKILRVTFKTHMTCLTDIRVDYYSQTDDEAVEVNEKVQSITRASRKDTQKQKGTVGKQSASRNSATEHRTCVHLSCLLRKPKSGYVRANLF